MLPMRMMAVAVSFAAFTASAAAEDATHGIAPSAILVAAKSPTGSSSTGNRAGEANPARYGYRDYRGYRGYRGYRPYGASPSNTRSDLDNVEPRSIVIRSEASSGPAQGPRLLQPQ